MPRAATWIFLAIVFNAEAFAQLTFHFPNLSRMALWSASQSRQSLAS
jgi:hypothetical protein